MRAATDQPPAVRRTVSVSVSPCPVDAGADLTITVRAVSDPSSDLTAQAVFICDGDGAQLAATSLAATDETAGGEMAYAATVAIAAPMLPGERVWRVMLPATADANGLRYGEAAVAFSFVIAAHAAEMNVWGLPPAIAAGEHFALKVGIKCPCNCNLAGRPFSVFDAHGNEVGSGCLGATVWPGTRALYFAQISVPAPALPGYDDWSVRTPAFEAHGRPHAPGEAHFGVRTMPAPEAEVTITAFDRDQQIPIKGIHVLLHPYRAYTDEAGVARLRVARGRYPLVVSGLRYVPYEDIIDATGDVNARAELALEPRGDGYFQA